ncbi:MAG: hypothetical protein AW10_02068 [Candidatus Accumulibacter appositus]|uniref:Uncharacterized protein n=1 Tax=Candidatus Accumulibacter appositus TaxID=1454003 RepID=A0A011NBB9_9PROT|nr:MAG: hypothetical protein AW10_02068 [Candidatus Accumulibacter appositus]
MLEADLNRQYGSVARCQIVRGVPVEVAKQAAQGAIRPVGQGAEAHIDGASIVGYAQELLGRVDDRVDAVGEGDLAGTNRYRAPRGDGSALPVYPQGLVLSRIDGHPVAIEQGGDGSVDRDVGPGRSRSRLHGDRIRVVGAAGFDEDEFAASLHVVFQPVGGDVVRVAPGVAAFDLFVVQDGAGRLQIAWLGIHADVAQADREGLTSFDLLVVEAADRDQYRRLSSGNDRRAGEGRLRSEVALIGRTNADRCELDAVVCRDGAVRVRDIHRNEEGQRVAFGRRRVGDR